ncbi:uncharacterized protein [Haliotis cracherodii]|uniref:uncharacterized protein isoform X1 n=1 Tax=Haliotis cracherodii TaxID=6455 RepID=UPI0039E77CA6
MATLQDREFTLPLIKRQGSVNRVSLSSSNLKSLDLGGISFEGGGEKGSYGHALYAGAGEMEERFSEFGATESTASYEDDTAEGGRRRAERAAEFEVEHNWMLKEAEERQYKKFDSLKRRVAIYLPDEDPIENINHRLAEIQAMVKPRAEMSSFIKDLDPQQMERILKVTNTDAQKIREERRKGWRPVDRLAYAVNMVGLIARSAVPRRRHFNDKDPEVSTSVLRRMRRKQGTNGQPKTAFKSSLSFDMQLALTTQPEYRSNYHLKRVSWVLRATKAFKHLFPSEMERELARVVAYERYDDNRHLAYQGRAPERFYYILSGRIQRLREYRLTSGCINKSMGFLSKGMTSNPEDVEGTFPSEFHLVAKGPVEVLMLHRDDFIRLQHTTQSPPIDFLWSLDLFKEFPCDQFLHNHDAIEFTYYGQNRVIAKDAHNSPWIYVIKSGNVKVVRVQFVVDVRNDTMFASQNTEELGCGRAFSHASDMLGLLAKQRKLKGQSDINLPELMKRRKLNGRLSAGSLTDRSHNRKKSKSTTFMEKEAPAAEPEHVTSSPTSACPTPGSTTPSTTPGGQRSPGSSPTDSPEKKSKDHFQLPPIVVTHPTPKQPGTNPRGSATLAKSTPGVADHMTPHGTFLTREKTEFDAGLSPRRKKDLIQRRAYLQLDTLSPGDVFGLENLDPPPLAYMEGPAISLVSDGAEVVKISKRFFLQFAQNNTMLRVETMQREYITTDEAKDVLYNKETWRQYKSVLMERLVGSVTSRT